MLNLFLLGHLLLRLSPIRSRIGSFSIFAGSGTATVRHCRSGVWHYHCLCRLICTNSVLPFKLHTLIAIHNLSSICLGSFRVVEPMLDWGVSPLLELRSFWFIHLLVTYLSLTTQATLANYLTESCNLLSYCLHVCKVSGISIQINIITFFTTLTSGGSRGILYLRGIWVAIPKNVILQLKFVVLFI
jgi:hypothetical protein